MLPRGFKQIFLLIHAFSLSRFATAPSRREPELECRFDKPSSGRKGDRPAVEGACVITNKCFFNSRILPHPTSSDALSDERYLFVVVEVLFFFFFFATEKPKLPIFLPSSK